MAGYSKPKLVSAVSNAGGLGARGDTNKSGLFTEIWMNDAIRIAMPE
jgi:NAD(P)H-dependent flavin oxidoreductase YrpB (nitropropane dioxygenase family)